VSVSVSVSVSVCVCVCVCEYALAAVGWCWCWLGVYVGRFVLVGWLVGLCWWVRGFRGVTIAVRCCRCVHGVKRSEGVRISKRNEQECNPTASHDATEVRSWLDSRVMAVKRAEFQLDVARLPAVEPVVKVQSGFDSVA
jgi:hypothetical protein